MNQHRAASTNSHVNLEEAVEQLQSREDFAAFVRALAADLQKNPDQWENPDLPAFLEAMSAWVEDTEKYYQNREERMPDQPSWRTLGQILLAARVYE
jgi:hypothetical protein